MVFIVGCFFIWMLFTILYTRLPVPTLQVASVFFHLGFSQLGIFFSGNIKWSHCWGFSVLIVIIWPQSFVRRVCKMSRKITAFFKRVEPDTSDKTESLRSEGAGIGNQESDSAPDHDVADLEDLEMSSTSSESMTMSDRNTRPAVGPSTSTSSSGTATASRPRKHVPLKKDKRRDRMRTFPHKWLKQFQWLRYNKADNAMYCQCCRARQVSGVWCTGTRNFR